MMIKYLSDDDELFVSSLPISYYTDADQTFPDEDEFLTGNQIFLPNRFFGQLVITFCRDQIFADEDEMFWAAEGLHDRTSTF